MDIKRIFLGGIKYITDKDYRFLYYAGRGKYDSMPDELYICKCYKAIFGKELDLANPITFSEKLQWLKLNDHNPDYTIMVDKFLVRNYVDAKIGKDYLIPLLGVWDTPDEIDFNSLPEQFVLKCNHNSGTGMCICKDKSKIDIERIKEGLRKGLNEDYYLAGREWPYKNVPRKIVCEKYMVDKSDKCLSNIVESGLKDYKLFCFNGKVRFFKIDFDRFTEHHANYYDVKGNLLPFGEEAIPPKPEKKLELPRNLDRMIELAETLANNLPFMRVDFYNISGKIYFGELTIFPISGLGKYIPEEWDTIIGGYLNLPIK